MKKLIFFPALLVILITIGTLAGCSAINTNPNVVAFEGTVKYVNADGGFFGLVSDSGVKYDATNLSPEYRLDGLRVRVQGMLEKDRVNPRQWGTLISIVQIKEATAACS